MTSSPGSLREDPRGCPVGTRSATAVDHAETALRRLVTYVGDPFPDLDAAIAADPTWVLPHVMKANGLLTMTEHGLARTAIDCLVQAEALAAPLERERRHLAATRLCAEGRWDAACRAWDDLLADHPRDLVALHAAHLFDFYRGDTRNLQRRVTRVLPAWSVSTPLGSHVFGMHAFGLEENNRFDLALEAAHAALSAEPRDAWAIHAVAHVHEMRGDFEAGAAWLTSREHDWAPDNALAYHNAWHLALFALERGDGPGALKVLDERVAPGAATAMQRLDIAALLWRLRLTGVDVGDRWRHAAAGWPLDGDETGFYAFNDFHAAMAMAGAGRWDDAAAILERVRARGDDTTDLGAMARDVGVPLIEGLIDHARGRHDSAARRLAAVRDTCHRFGGSHAQRDLVDLTLMDAAARGGRPALAWQLLNERRLAKPDTPLTRFWAARCTPGS